MRSWLASDGRPRAQETYGRGRKAEREERRGWTGAHIPYAQKPH